MVNGYIYYLVFFTVTLNAVSPSGFGHVVIFERSACAVVARAPPEIRDPNDFGANTKLMGKSANLFASLLTTNLLKETVHLPNM